MAIRVELWTSNIKITWHWFANMRVSRVKSETRQAHMEGWVERKKQGIPYCMEGGAERKKQSIPCWPVAVLNSKATHPNLGLAGYKVSKYPRKGPLDSWGVNGI